MTYDTLGRLTRDADAAGGSQNLARIDLTDGYQVTRTTGLGRTTQYQVETLPIGTQRLTNTFPDGSQSQLLIGTDGSRVTTVPDGTVFNLLEGPDPRFSMMAPLPSSQTVKTPSGLTSTTTTTRMVNLTDPNNPLSLTSLMDTVVINGQTFTSTYDAATKTFTDVSATGRQSTSTIDTLGRVVHRAINGLSPVDLSYDARGRLASVTQSDTSTTRTTGFSYNGNGFLQTITDPVGRAVGFTYDPAGRVTTQTLPDGRQIQYTYDANGNLTSLTPPGRPAHEFAYTPVDLNSQYLPPNIQPPIPNPQTLYSYNADRQLTQISRPDGKTVGLGYDNGGRLSTQTIARGQTTYGYDGAGNLAAITAPDGGRISYAYDGSFLTGTSWTGVISGSVNRTYDNNFQVTALGVNSNSIVLGYDNDSLLTSVGDLTLTRDAQNGLITGTALGNTTDARTYSGFGELTNFTATVNSTTQYQTQYTRDQLGRITQKVETVGGVTTTFNYHYDQAGRLDEVKQNGTTTAAYTYDSNGNRLSGPGLSTPPTYDAQDRLTQYGSTTYTYTANGELLTKSDGAQSTTYTYDELGNLLSVALPGSTQIDYITDGQNRRIGKKVGGTLSTGVPLSGWSQTRC